MKKILSIIIMCLALNACTSDEDFQKGKRQLEQQGYTDIQNTGYASFCCGEDDKRKTGFSAKTRNGEVVEGCFCSSFNKGVTIRFK